MLLMDEDPDPREGFVAVPGAELDALAEATADARTAASALRGAVERLAELADDYRIDAVRRLRERGASEAQVARYERAFTEQRRAVRDRLRALDEAFGALGARADGLW